MALDVGAEMSQTKDITDAQVVAACVKAKETGDFPLSELMDATGMHTKVCYSAMQRAARRGLIDYGVSLRTGWATPEGLALLEALKSGG